MLLTAAAALLLLFYSSEAAETATAQAHPAPFELRGICERLTLDTNGVLVLDNFGKCDFSITVDQCRWMMVLSSGKGPAQTTVVADDGMNCYLFVPGAAGTQVANGSTTSYRDSASLQRTGTLRPRMNGTPIWLLFASGCALSSPAGDAGDVFGGSTMSMGQEVNFRYERTDDFQKNSLGPSRLLISRDPKDFPRDLDKASVDELLAPLAELLVMESGTKDGRVFPRAAELREVHTNPATRKAAVDRVYRLTGMELRTPSGVPSFRPQLTNLTSVTDFRLGEEHIDYLSSDWKSLEEVKQLARARLLQYAKTREPARGASGLRWRWEWVVLAGLTLAGGLYWLGVRMGLRR